MEQELEQLLNEISIDKTVKSKKLDGICLSQSAPKNTNVLWIQYDNLGKFTLNIYWCDHWHAICSEANFNEIIKKLKQLFNTNDTRLLQIINQNLKKVTYIDDYVDIDLNPLTNETIADLLRSIVLGDDEHLPDLLYGIVHPIEDEIIVLIVDQITENYGNTGT